MINPSWVAGVISFALCFYYTGLTITKNRFWENFYLLMCLELDRFWAF